MLAGLLALIGLGFVPPDPAGESAREQERFVLRWTAPDECPTSSHVEARIAALLGVGPVGDAPLLEVDAVVTKGEGFSVELSLRSGEHPPGVRKLEDLSCSELAEGVALIVALAVDPDLLARGSNADGGEGGVGGHGAGKVDESELGGGGHGGVGEIDTERDSYPNAVSQGDGLDRESREPDRESPEPDRESPEHDRESSRPASKRELRRGRVGLGLAALGGVGLATLPGATSRVTSNLSLHGPGWRSEVGFDLWIPRTISFGRYHAWGLGLAGCGVPTVSIGRSSLELPLCVRLDVGVMEGEGRTQGGRRARAPFVSLAPGLGLIAVPASARGWVGFMLRADAVLPLTRPAFATDEGRLLVRVGFGAQVMVGLELRFWRSGGIARVRSSSERWRSDPADKPG